MAEDVNVVDPDSGAGYNYDSLYDWEAGEQADIDASGTIAVAKCRCTGGTADTTAVTINGWTTSADDYIKIWTDPTESYRHNGTYQTGNKYRLDVTDGNPCCFVQENYVRFEGIQIKLSSATAAGRYVINCNGITSSNDIRFDKCIINQGGSASYSARGFGFDDADIILRISNTIVMGPPTTSSLLNNAITATVGTAWVYNSTFIGGTGGRVFRFSGGTCNAKNCYAGGASPGACYYFDISGNLTTCASADTTGSEGLQSIALNTTNFTNVTAGSEDYHLPSGSALIGVASNLYDDANLPFQDDIDGQDRGGSGASWDIGADEYVAAGGGVTLPVFMRSYRARRQ